MTTSLSDVTHKHIAVDVPQVFGSQLNRTIRAVREQNSRTELGGGTLLRPPTHENILERVKGVDEQYAKRKHVGGHIVRRAPVYMGMGDELEASNDSEQDQEDSGVDDGDLGTDGEAMGGAGL